MNLVLRTVEAFPLGRTTAELFALLDVEFSAARREAIQAELLSLQGQGLVTLGRDGKWRPVQRRAAASESAGNRARGQQSSGQTDLLVAAPARFGTEAGGSPDPQDDSETGAIEPKALLRYYRAALQSDPRGAMTEADDRHGTSFQLVSGSGNPFPAEGETGYIRVAREDLPDSFREALARREANDRALAVGWPIAVGRRSGAPAIRPVGLIPATWELDGESITVRIEADDVMANPDWIRSAAANTAWSQAGLTEIFSGQGGGGLPKSAFLNRLREAAARSVRGKITGRAFLSTLDPADQGIVDAIGLFLPTGSAFTAGAVRDLDEIATWQADRIARTALAPLLGMKYQGATQTISPVNIGPLNHEQIRAVANAVSRPLSVVTGPPGTGKSQAIVAMAATTILTGGTVAVASRNHQALDAVEERLSEIAPDVPFLVRTLDPVREVDRNMADVLSELVNQPSGVGTSVDPVVLENLNALARRRMDALDLIDERRTLHTCLAENLETIELRRRAKSDNPLPAADPVRIGFWRRLFNLLFHKKSSKETLAPDDVQAFTLDELEQAIQRDRARLEELGRPEDPVALTREIADLSKKVVRLRLGEAALLSEDERLALSNDYDDMVQHGARALTCEIARKVVEHRPLWLVSVLGAPNRIPLHEGLFDLVIFDEASQCDIASALPLLARARRAVIVGDDHQLAFISQIGLRQDRNLMVANGLPDRGTGRFAQGRKSLFDLARSTPGVPAVMLRDQYRSAEAIVGYINEQFYGRKLRVAADLRALKVPPNAKPGLAWTDIPGPALAARSGQNVNMAEVEAITREVRKLLVSQGYSGTVGIISPFRPQVQALAQALFQEIPEDLRKRAELRVGTVDGFQGQERDLILFSPTVHDRCRTSAITFLQRDWRRLNVAISRARAVAHVFGDLSFAFSGKIRHLQKLAVWATEPRGHIGEGVFDSEWERVVFHALKARGLDPRPQYEIAGRRLDFALFGKDGVKLDLEIDGRRWHQDTDGNRKLDDHWRDHLMKSLGWKVRRFWVDELKQDMEGCLDLVERDLINR